MGKDLPPHRGPLPLADLEAYAAKVADMADGFDGVQAEELVELLAFALRRVSLAYALRGAA